MSRKVTFVCFDTQEKEAPKVTLVRVTKVLNLVSVKLY